MTALNWSAFTTLPDAAHRNFELLARSIVRTHYGKHGTLASLKNQPSVEFHLRLHSSCDLGDPPRWFGWQCRWYDLAAGERLGTARRKKIKEALDSAPSHIPGLTDWILWTRHPLSKNDQEWFRSLSTRLCTALWTSENVEMLLVGPALGLREAYFGELILTPDRMRLQHRLAAATIGTRWVPELHEDVKVSTEVAQLLCLPNAWEPLVASKAEVERWLASFRDAFDGSAGDLANVEQAGAAAGSVLHAAWTALTEGDFGVFPTPQVESSSSRRACSSLARGLRNANKSSAPLLANLLAAISEADELLADLNSQVQQSLVAIVAEAGHGKSHLSAQWTQPKPDTLGGVLIHGRLLGRLDGLDALTKQHQFSGWGGGSLGFRDLVVALDAAGERHGVRIPIVIDGLNEAEDPRRWHDLLAAAQVLLEGHKNVFLIVTLRPAFREHCLPEGIDVLEMTGFGPARSSAIRKYFEYYRIEARGTPLTRHFDTPLYLRIFCQAVNPKRERWVGAEAVRDITPQVLFDKFLESVAGRISELMPVGVALSAREAMDAIETIGRELWTHRTRGLSRSDLRVAIGDTHRTWIQSVVPHLVDCGVLIDWPRPDGSNPLLLPSFDALGGHVICRALLKDTDGDVRGWLARSQNRRLLFGSESERHPLCADILFSIAGMLPSRRSGEHLWKLVDGDARTNALEDLANQASYLIDDDSVTALGEHIATGKFRSSIFRTLMETRSAGRHPLSAPFMDQALRSLRLTQRDLTWTEWLRKNEEVLLNDLRRAIDRDDTGRALWAMWCQTSTVHDLRNAATFALSEFMRGDPEWGAALVARALSIDDAYVVERTIAAAYGAACVDWQRDDATGARTAWLRLAHQLRSEVIDPGASHATYHARIIDLINDFSTLAGLISGAPAKVSSEASVCHVPLPFGVSEVPERQLEDAESALRMDFENYTLGSLVEGRRNYDFQHDGYRLVRNQVLQRVAALGYTRSSFANVDENIAEDVNRRTRPGRGTRTIERYGKKYSWIAYHEMKGFLRIGNRLSEWRKERRDLGVDPTFPTTPDAILVQLTHGYFASPSDLEWLNTDSVPDYGCILRHDSIGDQEGPWVLLDGYVRTLSSSGGREVFTFYRGLIVDNDETADLTASFERCEYPGNDAIPTPHGDHETLTGEVPWSTYFAKHQRYPDGAPKPHIEFAFEEEVSVEIPVVSMDSEDPASQSWVAPTLAICDECSLKRQDRGPDLFDRRGEKAFLFRRDDAGSELAYLRQDLLAQYLRGKSKTLVWLVWGERQLNRERPWERSFEARTNLFKTWDLLVGIGQSGAFADFPKH